MSALVGTPDAAVATVAAPGLTCRGVTVGYGGHDAITQVDLDVAPGEWTAIIGPNGAGKSTLLRAIAGVVPHEGSIRLGDGRAPRPGDVAMVPQAPVMPPGMSVAEYVLLGRTAHLGWLARESAERPGRRRRGPAAPRARRLRRALGE